MVWNPATGEVHAEVYFASSDDIDLAVASAKAEFPAWRATPLSLRSQVLFRLRNLIDQRRESLARIIVTENGKTLADAREEIARGLENVEFACGIAALLRCAYTEQVSSGAAIFTRDCGAAVPGQGGGGGGGGSGHGGDRVLLQVPIASYSFGEWKSSL